MKIGVDGATSYFALRVHSLPSHIGYHRFHHKTDVDGEVRSFVQHGSDISHQFF